VDGPELWLNFGRDASLDRVSLDQNAREIMKLRFGGSRNMKYLDPSEGENPEDDETDQSFQSQRYISNFSHEGVRSRQRC
jgi:hypothetical protein